MLAYVSGDAQNDQALPRSVEEYLRGGATEGERNARLFSAACQLRDVDFSETEAYNALAPTAEGGGLSSAECKRTLQSVFAAPKREAPSNGGGGHERNGTANVRSYHLKRRDEWGNGEPEKPRAKLAGSQPVPLPDPIEEGFRGLLMAAFEEGEYVCIAGTRENESGERKPESGVSLTREDWLRRIEKKGGINKVFKTKHGLFVRVNPMDGNGVGNLNVTSFRHALVEWDRDSSGADIPKPDQLGMILASHLPVTAILDSGNKSVHAWVRVDAADQKEYDERVDEVYALFADNKLDVQNRNASRLSRCPDAPRMVDGTIRQQTLLKTSAGAKDWDAWKAHQETSVLGEPRTVDYLLDYDVSNDPNRLIGNRWLCKGSSLVIVSQAGVGKSTLIAQLSIGWALGRKDLSFAIEPIRPLKSLVLQAENDDGDLAEMMQGVFGGFSLTPDERKAVNENLLFHRISDKTGEDFLRVAEALVNLHQPDILWIDPLLNFIGADINDQREIASFCQQGLNALSARTGVVNVLIHHMGKPPKDAKAWASMTGSDLAYAGLGSSALTNWARELLVFRRVQSEGLPTFELTATKRRKRAGMRDMETGEISESIYIQHSGHGMTWKQCPSPENDVGSNRQAPTTSSPAVTALPERSDGPSRTNDILFAAHDAKGVALGAADMPDLSAELGFDFASTMRACQLLGIYETT